MEKVYSIKDLEQLRVFSEPFRIKLLWSFYGKEKTGKMLADEFHMSPSKVRYHLTELERVGLVEVVRTELKNGIQQKFYLPVAQRFSLRKVAALINGEEASKLDSIMRQSAIEAIDEMREKVTGANFEKPELVQVSLTLSLTAKERKEIAEKIIDLHEQLERLSQRETDESTRDYYINLTLFPTGPKSESN
ncbi:helix-turn-helix domain-containing protein [Sporolactobacillus shoreicorticis]|uniref:Helix-turn-helix domain-containing protein n=1 Tax=Sporolactobacillus shoreicorticis TaxID=1923877 RepID=A0ABW5SAS0_9BACL|nr:helix-turn-helix domain-containing protein [Sporolactobacillus shoreicorticis]MCO7126844.1 helix-turn-helix domain-containing protein [Sporolactobacillus shoreicorticis]